MRRMEYLPKVGERPSTNCYHAQVGQAEAGACGEQREGQEPKRKIVQYWV